MIPGLALIEKLVVVGLNLFVENRERRRKLKENFDKFFKRSSNDSDVSSDLKNQYSKMRKEEWKENQ